MRILILQIVVESPVARKHLTAVIDVALPLSVPRHQKMGVTTVLWHLIGVKSLFDTPLVRS